MKKIIFISTIYYFCILTSSNAYLDPGSGSFLLQIIAFVSASILSFWFIVKNKIKNIFQKIFNKKKKSD
tara:strand:+ start:229 stop:435 length:207 start_codon:yes stop_codon:yes gene_type:complete